MKPGDVVYYHGSKVTVIRDDHAVPTPTGGSIRAVLIDRKRKGPVWVPAETLSEERREWRSGPQAAQADAPFRAPRPGDA